MQHFGTSLCLSDKSEIDDIPIVADGTYPPEKRLKVFCGGRYTGASVLRGSKLGMIVSRGHDAPMSAIQFDMVDKMGAAWGRNVIRRPVFKSFPSSKARFKAFGLSAPCRDDVLDERFKAAFWRECHMDATIMHFIFQRQWFGTIAWPNTPQSYKIAEMIKESLYLELKSQGVIH